MALDTSTAASSPLPDYLQAAKPNPLSNRAPWYKNTAPTYAGIFLWFAFWDEIAWNGKLYQGGLILTLVGVLVAGLICYYLFYLVPALFGMKTGLPLYIVGTSTFGSIGGLLMPGFLMGLLQFGWLAVNTCFSSQALLKGFHLNQDGAAYYVLCVLWAAAAAFVGLKGIQYVAKAATYLPLIPLAVLILSLIMFSRHAGDFHTRQHIEMVNYSAAEVNSAGEEGASRWLGMLSMVGAIVGFFATAGAAGVDFGMNSRDAKDVQWGGIAGILIAIVFTAGAAVIVVAGARVPGVDVLKGFDKAGFTVTNALEKRLDEKLFTVIMIGLPLAAFPGACFSSFIAANSFKTVMPKVNSFVSVGLGTLVSILLAVIPIPDEKGHPIPLAANLPAVFELIGASFGPICGAMFVDYLLSGRKWAGPRAGFNPAGWTAWLLGFIVGILPTISKIAGYKIDLPAPPVAAFLVGAVVYFVMAKAGMESKVLSYGPAQHPQAT
ncbi:MAG: cytosine permease [Gemmataceae bacterium]